MIKCAIRAEQELDIFIVHVLWVDGQLTDQSVLKKLVNKIKDQGLFNQ